MSTRDRDPDLAAPGLRESQRDDAVIVWTLDKPARRNAIEPATLAWIASRCAGLRGEIVVLRGAGPGFCAGFDLSALDPRAEGGGLPDAPLIAATAAMRRANATFVAAVHGYVIGAAVELVCACDLRIAADDATFRVPAAALGIVYHADGIALLRAVFGAAGATRLLLLGEQLAADEAYRLGALVRCVPPGTLDAAIDEALASLIAVDRESLAANRDLLRTLANPTIASDQRARHESARERAYANVTPPRSRSKRE